MSEELKPVAWMNPRATNVMTAFIWNNHTPWSLGSGALAHPEYSVKVYTFTDAQRKDLLAAALYLTMRDDPSCVLHAHDAERIAELLHDLSGIELPAIAAKEPRNG